MLKVFLAALDTGNRPGLAAWAAQASHRLPTEALITRAGWIMSQAIGHQQSLRLKPIEAPPGLHNMDLPQTMI